jgi:pimeloyl-ACP methyl ester carboxylesterase
MVNGRDLLDFRLRDLQQPTLIVWGAEDELIPLAVGKKMHEEIPNSSLAIVEGCGHLAPQACWESVVKSTVEFLRAEPAWKGEEKVLAER